MSHEFTPKSAPEPGPPQAKVIPLRRPPAFDFPGTTPPGPVPGPPPDAPGAPSASEPPLEGRVFQVPPGDPMPPWMASKTAARDTAGHARTWLGWHARYHAVRLPVYAGRLSVMAVRGTFRCTVRSARYMFAADYGPAMREALAHGHFDEYRMLLHERAHIAKKRAIRVTVVAGLAVVALVAVAAAAGMIAVTAVGVAAVAGAVRAGRKQADGPQVLDVPDVPVRVDLTADHLNDAFRAVGLLPAKAGKDGEPAVLRLVTPPLRDGKGWSVVAELPRGSGKTAADALASRTALAAELGVDEIQVIMDRVRAAAGGNAARIAVWVADDDPYIGAPVRSPLVGMDTFDVWKPLPFGQDARGNRVDVDVMWQSLFFGGLPSSTSLSRG